MHERMDLAYKGWADGTPLWTLVTILVIVFAIATIVNLLRKN